MMGKGDNDNGTDHADDDAENTNVDTADMSDGGTLKDAADGC